MLKQSEAQNKTLMEDLKNRPVSQGVNVTAKLKDLEIQKLKVSLKEHEDTIREFEQFLDILKQGGKSLGISLDVFDQLNIQEVKQNAEEILDQIRRQVEKAATEAWIQTSGKDQEMPMKGREELIELL